MKNLYECAKSLEKDAKDISEKILVEEPGVEQLIAKLCRNYAVLWDDLRKKNNG